MTATQAMTGQGGWPMTCFLTPDGEPFHCGHLLPANGPPRHARPSRQLLDAVHRAWTSGDDEIRAAGAQVVGELAKQTSPLQPSTVDASALAGAAASLLVTSTGDAADSVRRRSSRRPWCWSSAAPPRAQPVRSRRCPLQSVRPTRWPAAGSTTSCRRVRPVQRGCRWVCRTSRRCSTTTPCCYGCTRIWPAAPDRPGTVVATQTAAFLLERLRTREGGFAASLDADTAGVRPYLCVDARAS